jgi:hypothetical protein
MSLAIGPVSAARLFHKEAKLPLVYIEAVANSIDWESTAIKISINHEVGNTVKSLMIEISDNGLGIDAEGFDRFVQLNKPKDSAHRGIGRLAFVSNFNRVSVISRTANEFRSFIFEDGFDKCQPLVNEDAQTGTTLTMTEYLKGKVRDYKFLNPSCIKEQLLKEFFPLFHAKKRKGEKLIITVIENCTDKINGLASSSEIIDIQDLPSLTEVPFDSNPAFIPEGINLLYHIDDEYVGKLMICGFNIDGRSYSIDTINEENIPINTRGIFILDSPYFNGRTNATRDEPTMDSSDITTLKRRLAQEVDKLLKNEITSISTSNEGVKSEIRERYPHLGDYFPTDTAGLIIRRKLIDEATQLFVRDQQRILDAPAELDQDELAAAMDLGARVLMQYILFRNKTLERLSELNEGHHERVLHNLITPRFKTFEGDDEDVYSNNAWVLDEKFMSYSYVLSDMKLQKFIEKVFPESTADHATGEPDIAVMMSKDITSASHNDIVVVEMKRLGVEIDRESAVVNQLTTRAMDILDYFQPSTQRLWLFGIVEVTPLMKRILQTEGWSPLYSTGEYWHKTKPVIPTNGGTAVHTSFYIIPYHTLVADAKQRNETFMNLLRRTLRKQPVD